MVIVYILLPGASFSLNSGQESSVGFCCTVVHTAGDLRLRGLRPFECQLRFSLISYMTLNKLPNLPTLSFILCKIRHLLCGVKAKLRNGWTLYKF